MAHRHSESSGEDKPRLFLPISGDSYGWYENKPGPKALFVRRSERGASTSTYTMESTMAEVASTDSESTEDTFT